jgi:hypothetical protein
MCWFWKHKWKGIERQNIYSVDCDGERSKMPIGIKYVLQCEICGDIKKRKI